MASSKKTSNIAVLLGDEGQVVGRTSGRLGRDEEIVGGSAADLIEGASGNDSIEAGNGADTLKGGQGRDTLDGGAGEDVLIGGTGRDTYVLSRGDDTIRGYQAGDQIVLSNDLIQAGLTRSDVEVEKTTINGKEAAYLRFAINGEQHTTTMIGIRDSAETQLEQTFDEGSGSNLVLAGTAKQDILQGGEGNDLIQGEGEGDQLFGAGGDDTLDGGSGYDLLQGGEGNDQLDGDSYNDTLEGGDGQDTLKGGSGQDLLNGGKEGDELFGEAGDDTLDGGSGYDLLQGGEGDDQLDGGSYNDTLQGGDGDDTLIGGSGNDNLEGGDGSNRLEGGDGNDRLEGGSDQGANTLDGGAGDDHLKGAKGSDTYVLSFGDDTIQGYQSIDEIVLSQDLINAGLNPETDINIERSIINGKEAAILSFTAKGIQHTTTVIGVNNAEYDELKEATFEIQGVEDTDTVLLAEASGRNKKFTLPTEDQLQKSDITVLKGGEETKFVLTYTKAEDSESGNTKRPIITVGEEGEYTIITKFNWDNSDGECCFSRRTGKANRLSWLQNIIQFGGNKIHSGDAAFAGFSGEEITALEKLVDSDSWEEITSMRSMFRGARKFNQTLPEDFVGEIVKDTFAMFSEAFAFNNGARRNESNIGTSSMGQWKTKNIEDMRDMFYNAGNFNQDISSWNVSGVTDGKDPENTPADRGMRNMFSFTGSFKDDIDLTNWNVSELHPNNAEEFNTNGAGLKDGGKAMPNFGGDPTPPSIDTPDDDLLTKLLTTDLGKSVNSRTVVLPATTASYIDWGDGTIINNPTLSDLTHTYTDQKEHTIQAVFDWDNSTGIGDWNNTPNKLSWLADVTQFGSKSYGDHTGSLLKSGAGAFAGFAGQTISALPELDTSNLSSLYRMFSGARLFNQDLGKNFLHSGITNAFAMLSDANVFNNGGKASIGQWDTSNVNYMRSMFEGAGLFNQDLSDWNTSAVRDPKNESGKGGMQDMFKNTPVFAADLSGWNAKNLDPNLNTNFNTSLGGKDQGIWPNFGGAPTDPSPETENPIYEGTDGDDKFDASEKEIQRTTSDWSILGFAGKDTLHGGSGRDTIRGAEDEDILKGEAGNDKLDGGDGDDTLNGGSGNDKLVGGKGDDIIKGVSHEDLLDGREGDDTLIGGFGNDSLNGGAGNDVLDGGDGDDTYELSKGINIITSLFEQNADKITNEASFTNVQIFGYTEDPNAQTLPSEYLDQWKEGKGAKIIYTDGDDDSHTTYILNLKGNEIDPGFGVEAPSSGDGGDGGGDGGNLGGEATPGFPIVPDYCEKNPEDESCKSSVDDEVIEPNELRSVDVKSDPKKASFEDIQRGSKKPDKFIGDSSIDKLTGKDKADILKGKGGNDYLFGDRHADTLRGGKGADVLQGGDGKDDLAGGRGKDVLYGGAGKDLLTGNERKDIFVLSAGKDVITDFQIGKDDIGIVYALDLTFRQKDRGLKIKGNDGVNTLLLNVDKDDFLANFPDNLQTVPAVEINLI